LPVYVQPVCPQPNLIWIPGYWAYGSDGYYWVPGAWAPAPYVGALWTPPYWGWSGGLYVFHPGYWGRHVGYYGGVNYGFGYMGIGYVGGMWRGNSFAYNTAITHVDERIVHTTYVDREIVERNTVARDSRVSFNGGTGGIRYAPSAAEGVAAHEQHLAGTTPQVQHEGGAKGDRTAYFNSNRGQPKTLVESKPLTAGSHPAPMGMGQGTTGAHASSGGTPPMYRTAPNSQTRPAAQYPATYGAGAGNAARTYDSSHSNAGNGAGRPAYNAQPHSGSQPPAGANSKPAAKPKPESHGH
jgi:hypothetical protein